LESAIKSFVKENTHENNHPEMLWCVACPGSENIISGR